MPKKERNKIKSKEKETLHYLTCITKQPLLIIMYCIFHFFLPLNKKNEIKILISRNFMVESPENLMSRLKSFLDWTKRNGYSKSHKKTSKPYSMKKVLADRINRFKFSLIIIFYFYISFDLERLTPQFRNPFSFDRCFLFKKSKKREKENHKNH